MIKKIYVIHGWGGSPNSEAWFPWLKEECEKRGWHLEIPKMPDTNHPKIDSWVKKLEESTKIDNETYLIGHSIGTQTIMRYLDKTNSKVKGIIFIAGFFNLLDTAYEDESEPGIAKPWLEETIDTEKIKQNNDNILAIFSTNDECVPVSDSEIFKKRLNAKIIIKDNEGHFNNTKQINEIIDFIEK